MRTLALCLATLALCGVVAGCSGNARTDGATSPTTNDALTEVGGMIRNYSSEAGKGPAKQADLARYQQEYPFGWRALAAGKVVVVWGATVAGEGGGGGTGVAAYVKGVPESGGAVFLENGTVRQMTADEFKAAPKGGKK